MMTTLLKTGEVIGGYTVAESLTNNHFTLREVYRCTDAEGRTVALTVFNLEMDGLYWLSNHEMEADKVEELASYKKLTSSLYPRLLATGRGCSAEGVNLAWMATEWVEGERMDVDMANHARLPFGVAVDMARKLLVGIEDAYNATGGGGHYNLRPDNILLKRGETGQIEQVHIVGTTNLGLSYQPYARKRPDDKLLTTRLYRAPEYPLRSISDIFSFGIILAELLTAQFPYELVDRSQLSDEEISYIDEKLNTDYRPLKGDLNNFDVVLLKRAAHLDPERRLESVKRVREILNVMAKRHIEPAISIETTQPEKATSAPAKAKTQSAPSAIKKRGGSLDDVAGMEDLKQRLRRDFVAIVRHADMARRFGVKPPNGVLLYGAPGCGKTFVAEKAAQESGLNYRIIKPSDLGSIYVHGTQGKIAETFEEARKHAPIILIFDEFDAIAPTRTSQSSENQATEVNELLVQMNNCAERGIYIVAMTNCPQKIDSAVLRCGRLDEKFYVSLPDEAAREELFKLELSKYHVEKDIDYGALARATSRFTCGDITYIVQETARKWFVKAIQHLDEATMPGITQGNLLETIGSAIPSVSRDELEAYDKMRDYFDRRRTPDFDKPRTVGFNV